MKHKTYRAAVIGCGWRGRDHILAYRQSENAECVACCALSPTKREALAGEFGIKAYGDAEEMIRAEKPDIVHVVTLPNYRVEPLTLVSRMGVPLCTVEKPVATGVPDWQKLCELESSSRTRFAVCHQTRWNPHLEACRQATARNKMGQPLLAHLSAAMNITNQGTHTLNYGLSLLGDPDVTEVFGNACGWDTHDTNHPAPETTVAQLTLANGVKALWTSGPVSPRCGNPATIHEHVRVGAHFENGRVEWQQFGKWEIVSGARKESGRCFTTEKAFGENWTWEQAEFHKAMFAWLEDDAKSAGTNLKRSLHEWAVVLALYQSALERRPISMADFHPPLDLVDQYKAAVLRRTPGNDQRSK